MLPRFPGVDVIQPARVPPPPLLTGDNPEQWAVQLWRAYLAVIAPGSRPVRLADMQALEDTKRNVLLAAGPVLHARGTQPLPWCKFSAAAWCKFGPGKLRRRCPNLQWVYGSAQLRRADLWYQWRGPTTGGVRLAFSPSHRRLIAQYGAMRHAVLEAARSSVLTEEIVRSIVRSTLPEGQYEAAVEQARLESEMAQVGIDSQLRRGVDLWD